MKEENIRYAYRICPCFSHDIEGIQSWLEDMAARGLVLEADGTFLGIFTFVRTTPKKHRYRLTPVKQKKGFFPDPSDGPDAEEQEFSARCGWEYVLRHGSFYIYRATDPEARPLHTDTAVQAMALALLRKQRRRAVLSEAGFWAIYFGLRGSGIFGLWRSSVLLGPVYPAAVLAAVLWLTVRLAAYALRLTRYQRRLRLGDSLEQYRDWKKAAPGVCLGKLVPWVLALAFILTWAMGLKQTSEPLPLDRNTAPLPFATLEDVLPGSDCDRASSMGDYNTFLHYGNALSENWEWKETADITHGETGYYGILRLKYHKTLSPALAKAVAAEYYNDEASRYGGKRFLDLEAPETALDQVRVFSSYGIVHVLIQHENIVMDAVVQLSDRQQGNQWHLWLYAMEEILTGASPN